MTNKSFDLSLWLTAKVKVRVLGIGIGIGAASRPLKLPLHNPNWQLPPPHLKFGRENATMQMQCIIIQLRPGDKWKRAGQSKGLGPSHGIQWHVLDGIGIRVCRGTV